MAGEWKADKLAVSIAAKEMANRGLATGSSGNVSARLKTDVDSQQLFAITPMGKDCATLQEDDIAIIDLDITQIEGNLIPSSETLMHLAIYKTRKDVNAIIHTHSVFATVAAVAGMEIPPIIDEVTMKIGGPLQVSEYGFPGTDILANRVNEALGTRNAALIRNHGAIAVGYNLEQALEVCSLVEHAAQVFYHASTLGNVNSLPSTSIEAEVAIFQMRQSNSIISN